MQYIELGLESEGGGVIEKSDINFGNIINSLSEDTKPKYPWLWGVDPYGMTLFNLHQTPHIIEELKELLSKVPDENLKKEIISSIDFISKVKQHAYIRLIGD